jgi:hypothetical protein
MKVFIVFMKNIILKHIYVVKLSNVHGYHTHYLLTKYFLLPVKYSVYQELKNSQLLQMELKIIEI